MNNCNPYCFATKNIPFVVSANLPSLTASCNVLEINPVNPGAPLVISPTAESISFKNPPTFEKNPSPFGLSNPQVFPIGLKINGWSNPNVLLSLAGILYGALSLNVNSLFPSLSKLG